MILRRFPRRSFSIRFVDLKAGVSDFDRFRHLMNAVAKDAIVCEIDVAVGKESAVVDLNERQVLGDVNANVLPFLGEI